MSQHPQVSAMIHNFIVFILLRMNDALVSQTGTENIAIFNLFVTDFLFRKNRFY